jgi:hypothetical protein
MALGISRDDYGRDLSQLDAFVSSVGRPPAMWSIWSLWGDLGGQSKPCTDEALGTCAYPSQLVEDIAARSETIIPVIWWEPTNPRNWEKGEYERYKRIVDGKHDAYLKAWAKDAKASGRRVIVRFAHELNGNWFPWGVGRFDNTPRNFKQAWRHVWGIFKREGALAPEGNVELLWSVTKQNCPQCNPFSSVYPGDRYVHWVGLTAFNWGASKTWKSMPTVLAGPIADLQRLTRKGIIVAELASHVKGGDKARWIRSGYAATYDRWPRVKAVMYLDSGGPKAEWGHPDWRLAKPNDGSALAAYATISADPRFQGAPPKP